MFYRGTMESILSSCIIAWFGNCTASDRKTLQRIARTAEKIHPSLARTLLTAAVWQKIKGLGTSDLQLSQFKYSFNESD
ncbi:hypothetical protein SRHO_G00139490 [Serrasalmus rhombeus]